MLINGKKIEIWINGRYNGQIPNIKSYKWELDGNRKRIEAYNENGDFCAFIRCNKVQVVSNKVIKAHIDE